ncbi:MAG: hypothetical protein ACJ75R_06125, partial [Solirubrobacterales bacterium]
DGRSLIPVAQNPGIEQGRELLIEQPTHLDTYPNVPSFEAIRTARYMYAEHGGGATELYDLKYDPFELVSRHDAPTYAAVKTQLAAELQKLRSCAGSNCRLHSTP